MTDLLIENPADVIPIVVDRIHHFVGWLERRRADELYVNSAGEIEISSKEMDKIIAGLKDWAKALEVAAG